MFCFGRSAGVSVAPVQDLKAPLTGKSSDYKNKNEDAAAREEQRTEAPHKAHKTGTGGSQAHAFVRHLIHNAGARCASRSEFLSAARRWPQI